MVEWKPSATSSFSTRSVPDAYERHKRCPSTVHPFATHFCGRNQLEASVSRIIFPGTIPRWNELCIVKKEGSKAGSRSSWASFYSHGKLSCGAVVVSCCLPSLESFTRTFRVPGKQRKSSHGIPRKKNGRGARGRILASECSNVKGKTDSAHEEKGAL